MRSLEAPKFPTISADTDVKRRTEPTTERDVGGRRSCRLPTLAAMGSTLTDGVGGSSVAVCHRRRGAGRKRPARGRGNRRQGGSSRGRGGSGGGPGAGAGSPRPPRSGSDAAGPGAARVNRVRGKRPSGQLGSGGPPGRGRQARELSGPGI